MKRTVAILLALASLLWVTLIFSNSLKVSKASDHDSNIVAGVVDKELHERGIMMPFHKITKFVRKSAHVLEFLSLGIILSLLFSAFSLKAHTIGVYTLFFGLFTAVMDEFIQSFVNGRGSLVSDVYIDFFGVITGFAIFYLAKEFYFYIASRRKSIGKTK